MAKRVCSIPGCPELTTKSKCEAHQAEKWKRDRRRWPDRRPSASQRGYDAKWRKTRTSYIARHPFCSEPECEEPTADVHHRDGLGPKGPRGHDDSNLEGLCHSHHSLRTSGEQPGGFRCSERTN